MSHTASSHRELLRLWPKLVYVASALDVSHSAVRQWASRDVIPRAFWQPLVTLAKKDKIPGVTYEIIEQISKASAYSAEDFT